MRWLCLLLLISCSQPHIIFDNNVSFTIETVNTPEARAKGLMFRESLPENHGMLFVFEDEAPRSFWMKNTLIPLDIIFIAKNMTVVDIKENVQPCREDPCSSYLGAPAMYVLEINAQEAKKNAVMVGSIASLT